MKNLTENKSAGWPFLALTGLATGLTLATPSVQANSILVIPSLGGMNMSVSDLGDAGHIVGLSTLPGDLVQHALRLAPDGTVQDLGTLGGTFSLAAAVNSLGQVTGNASTTGDLEFHAFLYRHGTMTDLGTLGGSMSSAVAINDRGEVAGNAFLSGNLESHAFLFQENAMIDLGTLGGSSSSAYALNNQGEVVGESFPAGSFDSHPFLHRNGAMTDLGTLGGAYGVAWDINDNSLVVGESALPNWDTHAFAYAGGSMIDLGTLGGTFSMAVAVNNSDQIIGDSTTAGDAEYHGFTVLGGVMIDLGTLGGSFSAANAINSAGQIVGDAADSTETMYPFLWENGALVDLNSFLPPNSGWVLWSALHINDRSQVSGYGLLDGEFRYYLLSLESQNPNRPPVAAAGPDQTMQCPGPASLDGSGSSDPDGDSLTFAWSQNGVVFASTSSPTVNLPAPGTYVFDLTVTDPAGASATDSVSIGVQDTTPPQIGGPLEIRASVLGDCLAAVPDLTTRVVVSDNCTDSLNLTRAQSPAPGTLLGVGQYKVTVTVTDAAGQAASWVTLLTVVDETAPSVVCPEPAQAPADGELNQAPVPNFADALQATDPCSAPDQLSVQQSPAPGTMLGPGVHEITLTVSDQAGNQTVCTTAFTVTTPEPCRLDVIKIEAVPAELGPPNHKMIPVTIKVTAESTCGEVESRIVRVTSSEPVLGGNDNTSPDWEITGALTVNLRAERSSNKESRVYTVHVECRDASDNIARGAVTVSVLKNNSDPVSSALAPASRISGPGKSVK